MLRAMTNVNNFMAKLDPSKLAKYLTEAFQIRQMRLEEI